MGAVAGALALGVTVPVRRAAAAGPTRRALLLGSAAWPAAAVGARSGGSAGGRGARTERVRRALQGGPPIKTLAEVEQDAVFDGMLAAYANPPAGVRDRLAGIAVRTREALEGERARWWAAAWTTDAERGAPAAAGPRAAAGAGGADGPPR